MIRAILSFMVFQFCLISIFGQVPAQPATTKPVTGTISGQISGGDGQKFSEISVSIFNANTRERRVITSNENGSFTFSDVPVGVYQIGAFTSAYVSSFPAKANNFRIGDNVSIRMVKGGVITGKVLDSAGRPVVGTSVAAIRVKDEDGHPTNHGQLGSDLTDDLGVYRIFGLRGGTYLISASPVEVNSFVKHSEVSTYFPSSTRNTAQEIVVQTGAEIRGIDVIHRNEQGHSVSGTAAINAASQNDLNGNVQLISTLTGASVAGAFLNFAKPNFALHGIPDGEYEVTAFQFFNATSPNNQGVVAVPTKIKVQGADVSGVVLNFIATASIQGRLSLEKQATPNPVCKNLRSSYLEETAIQVIKEDLGLRSTTMQQTVLSANGELAVTLMSPGLYRLAAQFPTDLWYLKSMTFPSKGIKLDVARQGIYVRAGEKLSGLSVVVAEGAASLQGKIIATPNQKLPSRIRIYLIPVEAQESENLTKYSDVVSRDASFNFTNLAPGKYWIHAAGISETEIVNLRNPNIWEAKLRAQLRRDAAAGRQQIELLPCQKVKDFVLNFAAK